VEIVISHCREPLDEHLGQLCQRIMASGFTIVNVTIYTKCGEQPWRLPWPSPDVERGRDDSAGQSETPPVVTATFGEGKPVDQWSDKEYSTHARRLSHVVVLPNVGRCDHSYAHHFASMPSEGPPLLLLTKDTDIAQRFHQPMNVMTPPRLDSALQVAALHGFGCATTYTSGSAYFLWDKIIRHSVPCHSQDSAIATNATISSLRKVNDCMTHKKGFQAPTRPLGRWAESVGLNASTTQAIAPVCVGGSFAVSRVAAQRAPLNFGWGPVARALGRGDNIEEGHFMERLWAMLLSGSLPFPLQRRLVCASTAWAWRKMPPSNLPLPISGQLRHCRCSRLEEAMANSESIGSCIRKLTPVSITFYPLAAPAADEDLPGTSVEYTVVYAT